MCWYRFTFQPLQLADLYRVSCAFLLSPLEGRSACTSGPRIMTGAYRKSFKMESLGHECQKLWFVCNVIFFSTCYPFSLFFFCNSTSLLFGGSAFSLLCVILVGLSIMWPHKFHHRNGHRSQKSRSECVHHFPSHSDGKS